MICIGITLAETNRIISETVVITTIITTTTIIIIVIILATAHITPTSSAKEVIFIGMTLAEPNKIFITLAEADKSANMASVQAMYSR